MKAYESKACQRIKGERIQCRVNALWGLRVQSGFPEWNRGESDEVMLEGLTRFERVGGIKKQAVLLDKRREIFVRGQSSGSDTNGGTLRVASAAHEWMGRSWTRSVMNVCEYKSAKALEGATRTLRLVSRRSG